MKTGEPIYPLLNDHGEKIAEISNYQGRAQIKFKDGLVTYNRDSFDEIQSIMGNFERDWALRYTMPEPLPRDRE